MTAEKNSLRNNQEALEWLFEDEFYLVKRAPKENAQEQSPVAEESTPLSEKKTIREKIMKPCMVFLQGQNPNNSRELSDLWRKILLSVQHTPNSVNIVELEPGIAVEALFDGYAGSPIIFWTGEEGVEDLVGFPAYEVQENEDVAFVVADTLTDIAKDRDKKVRLWQVLQTMDFTPKG